MFIFHIAEHRKLDYLISYIFDIAYTGSTVRSQNVNSTPALAWVIGFPAATKFQVTCTSNFLTRIMPHCVSFVRIRERRLKPNTKHDHSARRLQAGVVKFTTSLF